MKKFYLVFAAGLLLDFAVVGILYSVLPDPTQLLTGVVLVRTNSEGRNFRFLAGPKNRKYVRLDRIPEALKNSVLFLEDGKFYQHHGFDVDEVASALWQAWFNRARLRGASTISQQLVKNLYLNPSRTLHRKIIEALITIKLELLVPKNRILEIYLNSIDWGRGLLGIQEAAQHYFKKPVEDLSLQECVFLASIIPNPVRFGRIGDDDMPRRFVRRQMMRTLEYLYRTNQISFEEYEQSIQFPAGWIDNE